MIKKYFISILIVLVCFCFTGASFAGFGYRVVSGGQPVDAGGGGETYIVEENCEGDGTPAGWTDTGTVDWDYTTTALRGSQSLTVSANYSYTQVSFAGHTTVGTFFRFRCDSLPATNIRIAALRDGADNEIGSLRLFSDGAVRVYHGSSYNASSAGVVSANTIHYIWWEQTEGSGANGTALLTVETGTTKGASDASLSNGTSTADISVFRVGKDAADSRLHIYDQIIVDDAEVGNVDE